MSIVEDKLKKPLVTCIVLSYKSGEGIYQAIKSVLEQDYLNIELIIADDGTPEFDKKNVEQYIRTKKKNNITFFNIISREKNTGTVNNFNDAVSKSHGEYFIDLAGDDQFYNCHTITNVTDAFIKSKADILVGNAIKRETGKVSYHRTKKKYLNRKNNRQIFNKLALGNFISGSCTYYSHSYFEKYGLFDTDMRLIEDWPNMLKAASLNINIYYFDFPTVLYSSGGISTVKNKSEAYLKDYCNVINKYILKNNKASNFAKRYAKYMLIRIGERKSVPINYTLKYVDVVLYKTMEKFWNEW